MTDTTARDQLAEALYFANQDPRSTDQLLAEYRDLVLAEGAGLIQAQRAAVYADAGQKTAEGMDRARDLLFAARTTTAQEG